MTSAQVEHLPQKPGLFASCSFAIICSASLDEVTAGQLAARIQVNHGETVVKGLDNPDLSLESVTHFISTTFDFPEYDAACDSFTPVVKPTWVDASLAKDKLANPRQFNPDPRLFMSDVVVCCADLPEGDSEAIIGGVLAMGGLFTSKITSQVTHLVALTMGSDKCEVIQSRKMNVKIVLPHWFDDCLRLGRRIDEQPYLLPDPEILRHPNGNAPKGISNGNVRGATNPDPSTPPTSSLPAPPPRTALTVFKRKHVMLEKDLGIGSHLRGILDGLIVQGGGSLTTSVRKADMYICKYREGQDYKIASKLGTDVGNLAWLYYLITTNAWTSPQRRLLHYPIARQGVPGFKDLRISLSNYSGEARIYLENLITAAGAECTKTLKQDNTHLITAHIQSEKCAAAKDWGVHLVNHLWLEESYAKWAMQSVTDTRYTHFPRRTNLGEVVGQTTIDRSALERNFFSNVEVENGSLAHPRNQNAVAALSSAVDAGLSISNEETRKAQPKQAKETRDMTEKDKHRTPASTRFIALGKENETPGTTGSRRSKDAAAAKLHDLTNDIALYEKEKKRVGGVIYGGRRKNDEDRIVLGTKRSFDEASDTEDTDGNDPKKSKRALPAPSMHLLISGYKKWVNQPKVEDNDKKQLRNLGIIVTGDPSRATHLAAPNILRTHKFVAAVAYAPVIISTAFIDDCLENDERLDPNEYPLRDKANEKKLGVTLPVIRKRAIENQNQLLQGRTIYCLANIHGGFDTFKSIVEVNGGKCNQYQGRPGTMVPSRRADSESAIDDDAQNDVYLLSGPDPESAKFWLKFQQMAQGSRKVPRIIKVDWLLESAMCQALQPVGLYELRQND